MEADAVEADQNRKRGMILPFEPHSITFDDIKYSVDMPQVIGEVKNHFYAFIIGNYCRKFEIPRS